jgi:protein-tyrosine phosphatase
MIDTHCHLLPGLDDGPNDERGSVELARALVAQGVTEAVCTPHYAAMFPTSHAEAVGRKEALESRLAAEGVDLRLMLAAEVGPTFAASEPLDALTVRSIRGRYLLVEILGDSPAPFLPMVHERLSAASLLPIFAHAERSRALHHGLGVLDRLRAEGALVQVVAPSLLGRWGRNVEAAAWRIIDTGRADLLASDAHGARQRRPHLAEAADLVADRLSPELAHELTRHGPERILRP